MRIQRKPVSRRRLSLREKYNQRGNDMFRGAWGEREQQSTSKHSPLEVEEDLSHLKWQISQSAKGNQDSHQRTTGDGSPGRETSRRPRGKRIPGCLWSPPAGWRWGSAPPLLGTAAPWPCECPNPTEVPATARWGRRAAVPPEAYRCNAAAVGQAAAPRYHRDLNGNGNNIHRQHALLNFQLLLQSEEFPSPSFSDT